MSDVPDHNEMLRRIVVLEERMSAARAPEAKRDWSVLLAVVGTGIALAALIMPALGEIRESVSEVRANVTDLRERMAVVETLLSEHRKQHTPAE